MNRGLAALVITLAMGAAHAQSPVEATTESGDKVRLFPDGRWEFVDPAKRAQMPAAAAAAGAPVKAQSNCPPGWQGGLFGLGRCIPPDDPQYNRGSLGRK
jgi:hypothetical protein